jgi:iron(III) transport system substrate-binding protein
MRVLLFLLFFVTLCLPSNIRASTEEILAKVNKLSGAGRHAYLVENAKREGQVRFTTALRAEEVDHLLNAFMRRYPFLRATPIRGGTERNFARVEQESLAGKVSIDLWQVNATLYALALRKKLIVPYMSPEHLAYPERFKRKDNQFMAVDVAVGVLGYNRHLVSGTEAPRSYQDLLDAKWKSKIAMEQTPDREVMALMIGWGKDKALSYLKQLLRQDIQIRRGHVLRAQLLCAGEFHIAFELNAHSTYSLIYKGCPIKTVFLAPIPAQPTGLAVVNGTAHPHATILLYDWILSKEGITALSKMGRVATRSDVAGAYPEIEALQKSPDLALIMPEHLPEFEATQAFIKEFWK